MTQRLYQTFLSLALTLLLIGQVQAAGRVLHPPYGDPKAVFEFYFDHPAKMASALYWVRSYMNPLTESPYDMAPEFMNIVIVIHGTEVAALAKSNYEKYREQVERLKYYNQLGVKVRICALAAHDYGYVPADFHDFVEIVPSAITDLVYWQQQGYGLIKPEILVKKHSIEELR